MPRDKATNHIKSLLIVVIGTIFLSVWYEPVAGTDRIRVAFSAVSPTQGVLWADSSRKTISTQKLFIRALRLKRWWRERLTSPR